MNFRNLKKIINFDDPTFLYCRIVSLACSPLGGSFVCSATIETKPSLSMTSVFKHTSPDQENQGTLLLWDLKTAKLEVCMYSLPTPVRAVQLLLRLDLPPRIPEAL